MSLLIRRATLEDQARIAEFNRLLALETEDLRLDPGVVQKGVRALLSDSTRGFYLVAESTGDVVGQAMITYEWSDWRNGSIWWLQSVYVKEGWRGKGVFKSLLNHVKDIAKQATQVCAIRLYVHEENEAARKSYERLGFDVTAYEVFELAV